MKIRGTASQIAEKYVNLARDSQSSGDIITAENYLQHAEHYFRIIASAQSHFSHPNAPQPKLNAGPEDEPSDTNGANRSSSGGVRKPGRRPRPNRPVKDRPGADRDSGALANVD